MFKTDDMRIYLLEAAPLFVGLVLMIVIPIVFLKTSDRTVSVVKSVSEPKKVMKYEDGENKVYYTGELYVKYRDPRSGETVFGNVKMKAENKNHFPEVGKELPIYVRHVGNRTQLVAASPVFVYYFVSALAACLLVGYIILLIIWRP